MQQCAAFFYRNDRLWTSLHAYSGCNLLMAASRLVLNYARKVTVSSEDASRTQTAFAMRLGDQAPDRNNDYFRLGSSVWPPTSPLETIL